MKRPVGSPRRTLEATLLTPKVEEEEPTSKKLKVRDHYTNWFEPSLWDPIYDVVRRGGSHIIVVNNYHGHTMRN